jgi:type IV secretion system protein TrbG
MKCKIVTLILITTFLCSCQHPKTANNEARSYSLATKSDGNQKIKYVPVPMPGQFMSTKNQKTPKHLTGEAAINAANKKAMKQPTSGEYINSIMTFDYMPGALYQLYSAPLSVTDIQFQNNEHIVAVGAGDTLRWQVSKTYSGVGATRQEHLLVKPIEDGLTNSLVVTTDLRTYHLILHSTPKTYMASVAWRYPDGDSNLIANLNEEQDEVFDGIDNGIDINNLKFNYYVKLINGRTQPEWFPRMVFNDGKKTYIKFAEDIQEAPNLFVGDSKNRQVINYRVQGNYYIVDNVIIEAQLCGGLKNNTIVQITMKK